MYIYSMLDTLAIQTCDVYLCPPDCLRLIDNHGSGYLGMARWFSAHR